MNPRARESVRLALVLWNGGIGGAEVLNASLAQHLIRLGAEVTIVFVGDPEPLAGRLSASGVPHRAIGIGRGRNVLLHPRRYAAEVERAGPDGALVVECGYIGAALRIGGYRAPIVAVEHGPMNDETGPVRRIDRRSGAWADDVEVAVSDFILGRMRGYAHARELLRIHNGVDTEIYAPGPGADAGPFTVGFVGRLVEGKGVDHLIRAVAQTAEARLRIAGDGPDRGRLIALAREMSLHDRVEFLGTVADIPAFWHTSDIAAVPTAELQEAFSMVTLEAMACGKPVIATRSGAIPELVIDGETGTLVERGNVAAISEALAAYARSPELRHQHAAGARKRAVERFRIERTAAAYLELFTASAGR